MLREIKIDDIEYLAAGSAFLGTGGGGDPYLGSILCREAISKYGPVPLLSVEELSDSDAVFVAAAMGAPTVLIEKLFSLEDQDCAVRALERHTGREASAIISAEIGGCNSMMPVAYAAMRGLPLVDGDGMGRAFPALQMTSFNIAGVDCAPLTLADEHGNCVLIEAQSGLRAEELARPLAAEMGAGVSISCYAMTGKEARRAVVPNTLSGAIAIGEAVARNNGASPVDRLLSVLRAHRYYREANLIFAGKIVDLERNTRQGWVFGKCEIAALDGGARADVAFQNENLSVYVDGALKCVVPDLITLVDLETAEAIPTERLAYGQRVGVIGCSAPPQIRNEDALKTVGPQCFGLDISFTPIENLMRDVE